ncbi:MAG: hypothetical protein ACK55I_51495, partial [bacterium]
MAGVRTHPDKQSSQAINNACQQRLRFTHAPLCRRLRAPETSHRRDCPEGRLTSSTADIPPSISTVFTKAF